MDGSDELYGRASAECGAALKRLARGYEADPELRRDLLQDIHIAVWRSFRLFENQCSLQTWVYRVAHNVGASHVLRRRRIASRLVNLEDLENEPALVDTEGAANRAHELARLLDRIHSLKPVDRQVMLLYLEGESAAVIAEITGLSPSNIGVKIHRIRKMLERDTNEARI